MDSRNAAAISENPTAVWRSDAPQPPSQPSAAASVRTLKNVGAASTASITNGAHHKARAHGGGSGRTAA
jgi:hypothetical protein